MTTAADEVTIGLVQMKMDEDPSANMKKAADRVREAARKGARIVCLPELYRTTYFASGQDHGRFDLAEAVPGPSSELFAEVAKETKATVLVPIFEKAARGLHFNSLLVVGPDGAIRDKYRKMHIPDDPGFNEKFYFAPGDLGFRTFPTPAGPMGALICWDQWYPEAARLTALQGAEVLFYPTAIGFSEADRPHAEAQHDAWRTIQRAHAIANGVFVAAVNRVGREEHATFWGGSFIADPFGRVLAEAGDAETILVQRLDLRDIEKTRRAWPFFRDRRIDAYGPITRRFSE